MSELRAILDSAERLTSRGEEAVLATVVKVEGSTYRRPGARLLVARDGQWVGGISGGCLEGDLVRKAWWRTENGPVVVTYDSTADDETAWQFGLGCNGIVHVLLQRIVPNSEVLAFLRECLQREEGGVLATIFRADSGTGVAVGGWLTLDSHGECASNIGDDELRDQLREEAAESLTHDGSRVGIFPLPVGEVEVFLEVVRPPLQLVVFGAGFDAVPLVRAAKALGWRVIVVDHRPTFSRQPAFALADEVVVSQPREACGRLHLNAYTAAVVMNHNFPTDLAALAELLPSAVRYIGVLGPRARTEKLLAELSSSGDARSRLHAPVGLDIGADTPEEIAVSVVAQIVAEFTGHDGGNLRDRPGPIHRRAAIRIVEVVS